jgi:hypothetical protein
MVALCKWGVPHTMLVQHAGDVLLLAPGCYYAIFDSGACVSEAMCWADGAGAARTANHEPCNVLCRPRSLAEHSLAPLQWQAAANLPLTVALVPWQLSATPTCLDRRYQPALGRLWRLGDAVGGVVQLVDGARAVVSVGPHSTDGVSSLSLSLLSILTVTITYSTCLSDAQAAVATEARRIRAPRVMGTQLGINWAEVGLRSR